MGVKLDSRCFIRDGVTSIIFTEVTLKLYCVEVVDITYITFFITSKMAGFEPTKQHMREALLFCFNLDKSAAESHRQTTAWVLARWTRSINAKTQYSCSKAMLCILWGQGGMIHHKLLKLDEIITAVYYKQQLMKLDQVQFNKLMDWSKFYNRPLRGGGGGESLFGQKKANFQ